MNANGISKLLGTHHTRSTRFAGMIRGAGRRTPGFIVRSIGAGEVLVECFGPDNQTDLDVKLNTYRATLESAGYVVLNRHNYITSTLDALVVVGTVAK